MLIQHLRDFFMISMWRTAFHFRLAIDLQQSAGNGHDAVPGGIY